MQSQFFKYLFIIFTFILFHFQPLLAETCSNPYSLSIPGTVNGHLKKSNPNKNRKDYFRITLPASGTVHVYTTGFSGDMDGYLLDSNCNATNIYDKRSDSNVDFSFSSTQNRTFVIELYAYSGDSDYTLYVTFTLNPPDANDDSYTILPNNTLDDNVLTNDNGYNITVTSHTNPSHGTLSINSDGSFSYTPDANYEGSDSFNYTASDANGQESSATVTITVTNYSESTGGRDFILRKKFNIQGDVRVIGNTILCILNDNGQCVEPTNTNSNADTNLQKVPVSSSTLQLPSSAEILYARLYWQGREKATSDNLAWTNDLKSKAKKIKIKKEGANDFTEITADIADFSSTKSTNYVRVYHASADVTDYVDTNGTYSIDPSSFETHTGTTNNDDPGDGLGAYGAWVLVVVYKDTSTLKFKNVSIFDGYKKVTSKSGNIDISLSGFLTPKSGSVDSHTYVFTTEGDKYLSNTGDVIKMSGKDHPTSPMVTLGTFDSRIDINTPRTPDLSNNNGIDIHAYNVGSDGLQIIQNNETGADFQFTSDQDTYFPSLIVFSTELYMPSMCYDFSVKQDGAYFRLNRNEYPKPVLEGPISPSDLEITVYLKNKEADFPAENIAFKSDVNNSVFFVNSSSSANSDHIYVSNVNGARLIDRGTLDHENPLPDYSVNDNYSANNQGVTTGHDILKGIGSLDAQEYVYTKYTLHPDNFSGITDINESLGLSVSFYITAAGSKILFEDFPLGSSQVPLCPPSDAYVPEWGQFNVVESGQAEDSINNNIRTQISRKPFDTSVVFDATPDTGDNAAPSGDINTTVLVEIIDVDAFGDLNASCANPDSALTAPIFLQTYFTANNHQTPVTTQTSDYYNFAVKNAAFRIWYFTKSDDSLIQNWTASTTDAANKTLTSITGLYDANTHTVCSGDCTNSTSTTCFNCIFQNYAKPLCSRDNFSVRPESYDVRIYDNNQSNVVTDPKNDLSVHYGYDTSSSSTPSTRMQLAAGYDYRFDINATGHDNTQRTPGYTRYFTGANDYNATLIWDSTLSDTSHCNDTGNQNIIFYVKNGIMSNQERNSSNVGEYKLNIIDTSWTAVDWDPALLTHHSDSSFVSGTDCITNSTSSSLVSGKYGCTISTNHGTDDNGHYYRDTSILFHPYTFDLNGTTGSNPISPTYSTNFAILGSNNYIYYADIDNNDDENMSYHLNGTITALGKNNTLLTNFVDKCYAVPLDINITTSNRDLNDTRGSHVDFKVRFHDINSSNQIISALDINVTDSNTTSHTQDILIQTVQTSTKGYFPKNLNGTMQTRLNMNYTRKKNTTINPTTITFGLYKVNCTNENNCTFSADMDNNKTTKGVKDLNSTIPIKFYYGLANAGKQRYDVPNDAPYNANIYYQIYCFGATCNTALLPSTQHVNDIRWYQNTLHNTNNDGNVTTVTAPEGKVNPASLNNATNLTTINLPYDATLGYPYTTTIEVNASNWLIYNENDANATVNTFQVEYNKASSGWSGKRETNTTTKTPNTVKTNRRTMW